MGMRLLCIVLQLAFQVHIFQFTPFFKVPLALGSAKPQHQVFINGVQPPLDSSDKNSGKARVQV